MAGVELAPGHAVLFRRIGPKAGSHLPDCALDSEDPTLYKAAPNAR